MNFNLSNGGVIEISKAVAEKLKYFKQDTLDKNEAGGVLLGRFIKGSKNIIIDYITTPLLGDKATRTTFKRSHMNHQYHIFKHWITSKGTCHYLGEWHTHPEKTPNPSNIDLKEWKRKLLNDKFSHSYLFFVIVGIEEIKLWEGDRKTLDVKQLKSNSL